ncbi:heavy metal-responsive transcriptional regulator [Phototrophicus methaneseepsis]|uniref:Heavy metal-responsive transcriptional regulator n=1 Tax=Phototrophicus methaneseepsis TaxID=2710758 RepID=A0A7S8E9U7_9CHLR|nr:heavy metal-responsive transcriptional regulator [Phototrophicus methaneseepsis]QPC83050.1 heavy metal-responsive transcriptional regulator [Phototrophicus methaneseepsis]
MLKIGDLSEQTGVSTEAIRYYERIGLIPEPQRADNGYRVYTQSDVERLNFVRRARALDIALDEIDEILAFRERNEPPCSHVMMVMERRIEEIENRIRDLQRVRDEIKRLHEAGKQLPEDVQMKTCVCHLIQTGIQEKAENDE